MSEETIFAAALEQPTGRAGRVTSTRPAATMPRCAAASKGCSRPTTGPAIPRTAGRRRRRSARPTRLADTRTTIGTRRRRRRSPGFLEPSTRPDSLGRLGHYEVLEVLGRGGFGIVFRAFDDVLQRVVAVKVLAPQLAATSPARKRFLREARSSAAGPARERRAGLRGRGAAAAVPGDGVHPRRDAAAAARPHRPARRRPRCCGSAGRSPRGWPPPTPRT